MSTFAFIACRDEGTIEVHSLDQERGTLRRLKCYDGVPGVSTLVFDHRRAILYAGRNGETPLVSAFTVVAGGRLEHRGDYELPHSLAYLAFDGDALLVASYHDSALSRIPLDSDGLPTTQLPTYTDDRDVAQVHCVLPTRDGRHVYATSLGTDAILTYRRGGEGEPDLVRLPDTIVEPAGDGPRHLIVAPDGSKVVVLTEMGGRVLFYSRDAETGVLTLEQVASIQGRDDHLVRGVARIPGGAEVPDQPMWAADIRGVRGGEFFITTERTTSKLAVLRGGDQPRLVGQATTEKQPRAAAVVPGGELVFVAGELSDHISVYRVGGNGVLSPTQRVETGAKPSWITFQIVD
ncbi:beta-propeller fold lactonase family protein [Galactobacter sp.]|uniref:lactonase family protein n=1 Tax=Galactobacter sp. TaxID=2676125 RepID=UPI0025BF6621|nr:beta-propeller fold lactonase family protein [Galactobacter sp.]